MAINTILRGIKDRFPARQIQFNSHPRRRSRKFISRSHQEHVASALKSVGLAAPGGLMTDERTGPQDLLYPILSKPALEAVLPEWTVFTWRRFVG